MNNKKNSLYGTWRRTPILAIQLLNIFQIIIKKFDDTCQFLIHGYFLQNVSWNKNSKPTCFKNSPTVLTVKNIKMNVLSQNSYLTYCYSTSVLELYD